jgi:long-chain acyl-CoA synthetase
MNERPWLKHYPPGTPGDITLDPRESLVSVFERSCARFAEHPAFHSFGTTLSYADMEVRSRDFAAFLQSHGLRKGERIALMLPNILQYPIALFGALRAGLTVVNTNPMYTPRELAHQLKDSGASCIVVLENFAHVLEQVLGEVRPRLIITTQLGDMLKLPRRVVTNWAVRRVKKLVPEFHIDGVIRFRDALDAGMRAPFEKCVVDAEDIAFVQYTGGTTGVAKGAMLTHRNMVANLEQVTTLWRTYIAEGEEIVITALPLYHIFCLTCNCLTFMKLGCLNVLIANPRDIPGFISELKHWKFTFISGVSTLFNALLAHPRFSQLDFSRLKLGVAGGMALQPSVAERWVNTTHQPLIEGYGLTEASPVVACNLPDKPRLGSVGVPLPSTEISIREGDREVPMGDSGELCVRGPQVMRGYWQHPEETAKTLDEDGWLRTGDIAILDPDGFVRIVDRKKDMIIVSGFKVFPNEIESVLSTHEAVLEVGCIGVPDDRSGQAVKAYVVAREATLTADQLYAHCRQYLTAYKVPKYIEFRETLPKTNVGKILRRMLADEAQAPAAGAGHDDPSAVAH